MKKVMEWWSNGVLECCKRYRILANTPVLQYSNTPMLNISQIKVFIQLTHQAWKGFAKRKLS